jgi:hypothetical protein
VVYFSHAWRHHKWCARRTWRIWESEGHALKFALCKIDDGAHLKLSQATPFITIWTSARSLFPPCYKTEWISIVVKFVNYCQIQYAYAIYTCMRTMFNCLVYIYILWSNSFKENHLLWIYNKLCFFLFLNASFNYRISDMILNDSYESLTRMNSPYYRNAFLHDFTMIIKTL